MSFQRVTIAPKTGEEAEVPLSLVTSPSGKKRKRERRKEGKREGKRNREGKKDGGRAGRSERDEAELGGG